MSKTEDFRKEVEDFAIKMRAQDDLINKSMCSIYDSMEGSVEKHARIISEESGLDKEKVFNFLMINLAFKMSEAGQKFVDEAVSAFKSVISKDEMH